MIQIIIDKKYFRFKNLKDMSFGTKILPTLNVPQRQRDHIFSDSEDNTNLPEDGECILKMEDIPLKIQWSNALVSENCGNNLAILGARLEVEMADCPF